MSCRHFSSWRLAPFECALPPDVLNERHVCLAQAHLPLYGLIYTLLISRQRWTCVGALFGRYWSNHTLGKLCPSALVASDVLAVDLGKQKEYNIFVEQTWANQNAFHFLVATSGYHVSRKMLRYAKNVVIFFSAIFLLCLPKASINISICDRPYVLTMLPGSLSSQTAYVIMCRESFHPLNHQLQRVSAVSLRRAWQCCVPCACCCPLGSLESCAQ